MLTRILVKNFALIKHLELHFDNGFTTVTGETGSGKSLLVNALNFLAGARLAVNMIRDGQTKTIVEAEFDEQGKDTLILRRELSDKGRTRAFIDDSPVTLKELSEVTSRLLDITSQRAFSHLLITEKHLDFLDLYAGLMTEREQMSEYEFDYQRALKNLKQLQDKARQYQQERELYEFQLDQIETINPQLDEENQLSAEINRLEHFEDLHRDGGEIVELLTGGNLAAHVQIKQAGRLLDQLIKLDPELEELREDLNNAELTTKEVSRRIEERCVRLEYPAEELESLRERQLELSGLIRKFGGTFEALLEKRDFLRKELSQSESIDDDIKKQKRELDGIVSLWLDLALKVRQRRLEVIDELQKKVNTSLEKIGIKDADFRILTGMIPGGNRLYKLDNSGYDLNARGVDAVEFALSTNIGMDPKPIAQVASGGELSRTLLALKEALPLGSEESTIIFDEIDSGISGHVAHLVGLKIKALSKGRQMIAITHLPQIAGMADRHIKVYKEEVEQEMQSFAEELRDKNRVQEIAMMLSGGDTTQAAVEQAENLMKQSI